MPGRQSPAAAARLRPRPSSPSRTVTGIANLLGPKCTCSTAADCRRCMDVFRQHQMGWRRQGRRPSPARDFTGTPETATQPQHRRLEAGAVGAAATRRRAASATPPPSKPTRPASICSWPPPRARTPSRSPSTASRFSTRCRPKARFRSTRTLDLTAGQTVNVVRPTICPTPPDARFGLGIVNEPDLISADAKQFAKLADVVVVAVGFNAATEGEGHDRTFTLPWGQDALIEAIAAANPHTIVTLTGGGGMDIAPLARQGSRAAAHLVSRPGRRHGRRRGSLRQAQPRRQAARQLRPRLGRQPLLPVLLRRTRRATPRCTRLEPTASRSTTPSPTSSTATSSWSAIATGPPPASIRCSPSASASATPPSASPT